MRDRDWVLVTPPTLQVADLALAKAQCRISDDQTSEDGYLETLLAAGANYIEQYLNRGLLTQTWRLSLDGFCDRIRLPRAAPFQSVTSVTYYDTSGVLQTASTSLYLVHADAEPGLVTLAPYQVWPALQERERAVRVTYVTGWTSPHLVPAAIRHALLLLVEHWFLNREPAIVGTTVVNLPFAVEALLAPWRVFNPEGA